ncbi:importin-like protein [Phytophthora cinnamomi]|uniref:importin-like protein n=1 Tax=Phytophthora cinnamomi TaxID=4785 RepID=UPI00355A5F00|nr:importin-like protein [Phytophthora cinnamomi]
MADFTPEQLEACLLQLTHPDTEQIKQAEAALKAYTKQIAAVGGLLTQLQLSAKPEVRQLAALMLRKKIFKHWPKLDAAAQAQAKQVLLARAAEDPVHAVRSTVATLITALALHEVPSGNWPELMVFINTCANSASVDQREMSMKLLQLLGESMGTSLQPHFNDLKQLYAKALQDPENLKVRVGAMRAACSLVEFLEEADLRGFRDLVPLMITVLQQCVSSGAEAEAVEFMDVFSEIASHPFPILDQAFPQFIELLLQIILAEQLEVSTRASASYAIGEFIKKKPKTIGKKNLVAKIFTTMLDIVAADEAVSCGLISNLLERESKADGDDDDEDDESPGHLAQQTLDSLALSVPAKYLNPVVFGICNEYITSQDARKRKAGVLALGILSEGCCEFMCQNLNELLPAVYRVAQDADQHVREAACFALGQFAEFLQPTITDHYTDILPIGLTLLDDASKVIKATALYVLDEITQSMESEQVLPYLDTLVTKLVAVLRTGSPQLQKMALDAVGSIAIGAKDAFLPYFPSVAELIQPFWGITDPKFFFLRGAAIECLGYLATALGKEPFRPYFAPSMPFVFSSFELDDSELKEQAFVYFINVSSIFKEEFAPFLEQAATHVLQAIVSDEGLRVMDDDEDVLEGLDSDDEEDGDDHVLRHISIRTDALNSKVRAVAAVEELALNCGGAVFEPYIPKFLEALAPLTEYIHEDVRGAVAEALAALVICSFEASHASSGDVQVWTKGDFNKNILTPNNAVIASAVMKSLVEELLEDPEEVVVEKAFNAIKAMSARVGPVVTMDHMNELLRITKTVLAHEHVCQTTHEEDEDEDEEEGGSVLESASELIGVLAKCYGEHFLATFQELFPALLSFATGLRAVRDRAAAVGCFAEVLRELGAGALGFVESVFPVVLQGLASDNYVLKANSAFCMGILAEISGDKLFSAYEQMLQALRPLFETSGNDEVVTDNACAAVARMIIAGGANLPLEAVLPVFLGALPLKADMDESPVCFRCLNGLVSSQNPVALNLMPQVLDVYANALAPTSSVEEETQVEVKGCVRGLLQAYEAQMKEVIAQMSPDAQAALSSALN